MPTAAAGSITVETLWPPAAVMDLKARFFIEAAKQTGVSAANDFLSGKLQNFYRKQLFDNYATIPNNVPLAELPDYVTEAPEDITPGLVPDLASPPYAGFQESLKLDAPLAVQALSRPGFFPFNKFSSVPLGVTAARQAYAESGGNDFFKRLMIVPNCHVKRLRTRAYTLASGAVVQEVDGIETSNDFIDLSGTIAGNTNRRPLVVAECQQRAECKSDRCKFYGASAQERDVHGGFAIWPRIDRTGTVRLDGAMPRQSR
jgi:hypothetical protein